MNLTKVAEGLRLIADALDEAEAPVAKRSKPAKTTDKPQRDKKPAKEPDVPAPEAVIQALQKVAKACGRSKIDEILGEFNVQKVSALAEEDRADVIMLAAKAVEEAE